MPRFEIPVVHPRCEGSSDEHAVYFGPMLLSACDDFDPRSLLQAPRVVGVVAEPPAAQFGDTVS